MAIIDQPQTPPSPGSTGYHHDSEGRFRTNVRFIPSESITKHYKMLGRDAARTVLDYVNLLDETNTDKLTGIPNDKMFQASLDSSIELANNTFEEGEETNIGELFVDLDQFKAVNDRYGHEFGDRMIRLVAHTLTESLRPFDSFGRADEEDSPNGKGAMTTRPHGDELKVLIPEIEPENPREKMTRSERMDAIKKRLQVAVDVAVGQIDFLENDDPDIKKRLNDLLIADLKKIGFGVSIGTAIYIADESKEEFTTRADMSMQSDKHQRRRMHGIIPKR